MQSLPSNGVPVYRTRLLAADKAQRFAACLSANGRFQEVHVEESRRSPGKVFVSFRPTSIERQAAMIATEQDKRTAKAASEGSDYLFCLDKNLGRVFAHCFNPHSGETYELDLHGCSCPDWTYRGRAAGLRCKHVLELERRLQSGDLAGIAAF